MDTRVERDGGLSLTIGLDRPVVIGGVEDGGYLFVTPVRIKGDAVVLRFVGDLPVNRMELYLQKFPASRLGTKLRALASLALRRR